ncbi:MAG: hypothetical protein KZQ60_00670, partial [Candidatus Thiodiazotropha sp. (ex Lucinoma aequizonata)]|nr:hypothetical protein [Candidatus Thiodiazotropha sp. (ex Lucinoma aequizonata)]MCU7888741.1 hypothetical protein [Candidatus Thiodiazotropha sp. (ex Lucinoma aequizonata)]MCU7908324.1 hypothetical protein [Candidatus Thiodiazotropha sp. (ex Lucinoma aequizonata)]MCU7912762.1 hypothetical protein [Candidatus Thiodiazotropha sp. (ex Lucinoma aequizonata)]
SGQNRLSKIESILVDWDVPKSFTRSKTRLALMSEGYENLKWSKYDWLYNPHNMTHKQKLRFKSLRVEYVEDGQSMGDQRTGHVTLALCQQNVGSERLGSVVIMGRA